MDHLQKGTLYMIIVFGFIGLLLLIFGDKSTRIFSGVPFLAMLIMIKDLIVGGDGMDGLFK